MSDPRLIEVPWQQTEAPDAEVFPDDFALEDDGDLEQAYEDRVNGGFDFYEEGIIESLFDGPEDYEPSPYDGTWSEE